jgi:hypothetical protein
MGWEGVVEEDVYAVAPMNMRNSPSQAIAT